MVLVDSNVLLDVLTNDPVWATWSLGQLERAAAEKLAINPIIHAELAPAFHTAVEHANALAGWPVEKLPLPYEAAWPAALAFAAYRQRGGTRTSPLPDFFIGAHAESAGLKLLTRDAARYQSYFPKIVLICPS
jgi:predicted nucleic acid-binding protein